VTDVEVGCKRGSDGWRCSVRVIDVDGTWEFDVTSRDPGDLLPSDTGTPTEHDVETLVRETFEFLLEREHVRSILTRFDLTVVTRYFPEYPAEIRRRLLV
jgi:hypothetical protein